MDFGHPEDMKVISTPAEQFDLLERMMMRDDNRAEEDDWIIEDDEPLLAGAFSGEFRPWRILVVDDEADIHTVTRLALNNVCFKGRQLDILSAYSGQQAYEILAAEPDIALVLLDVVMETEDAGLKLVGRIRGELGNRLVRLVLRTGQPGQAPEERVIIDYDINDYKAKTDLTKQRLFTTVIAALRAYEGLTTIDRNNVGLRKILDGAGSLYQLKSLKEFASGVLIQISAILEAGADGVLFIVRKTNDAQPARPVILAATGSYAPLSEADHLPAGHAWSSIVDQVLLDEQSLFIHPLNVLFVRASAGHHFVIAFMPPWPLGDWQRNLLGVFCDRIAAVFDNMYIYGQLQRAQEATVVALADLAESRDTDTGGHVQRVCKLTDAIATQMHANGTLPPGLPEHFLAQVGLASMLHDIGKVATPDSVLLKPARHTPDERAIMEKHVSVGENVLMRAAGMVEGTTYLTLGAQIAGGHHEHFDGNGYPRGLAGAAIPFGARIVAVVDVFDALLHQRPYKEPWPLPKVVDYLVDRRATQFDPDVIDALLTLINTKMLTWLVGENLSDIHQP